MPPPPPGMQKPKRQELPAGQGMPFLHWAMGGMHRPRFGWQHCPLVQAKVGGHRSPEPPQPTGGGTQRLRTSRQHWPFTQLVGPGQAAPMPQPGTLSGTHWRRVQVDPGGQGVAPG